MSKNRRELTHAESDYSSSDDSDYGDTDDEEWGEATDCPLEVINRHLMKDVREYDRQTKSDSHCALCPFRRSQKPWRLREHLLKYHTEGNNWCASGSKKIRICAALRDSDKLINLGEIDDRLNYLRRSASTIRSDFATPEYDGDVKNNAAKRNHVDIDIRIAQYTRG